MQGGAGHILSIIIPTKNRAFYAERVVKAILNLDLEDCEIVIQDNSDTDELRWSLLPFIRSGRVVYNHHAGVLSFVDNFNMAIEMANGDYLCVIGDDDAVNPEIIDVAKWAKVNGIEAISYGLKAVYYWPVTTDAEAKTGTLVVLRYTGKTEECNIHNTFSRLLRNGGQGYVNLKLPKVYHGMVSRDLFERVRNRTGRYFGGLSPDMYAVTALSCLAKELVYVDFPLTIPGICETSGSAQSATGRRTGDLRDAPHLRGHTRYEWSNSVPDFYSVQTIWADSMLHALDDCGAANYIKKFSVEMLCASCMFENTDYRSVVAKWYYQYAKNNGITKWVASVKLAKAYFAGPVYDKLKRKAQRIGLGKISRFSGVVDVESAMRLLRREMDNRDVVIKYLHS